MLDLMRLLSGLESWALSRGATQLPDYLHEQLGRSVALLEREILGESQ